MKIKLSPWEQHLIKIAAQAAEKRAKPYTIQAITTKYKGIQFRSRLEAQWAVMFDHLGWWWCYEPFCIGGIWLPDFVIGNVPGRYGNYDFIFIECKPNASYVNVAEEKIEQALAKQNNYLYWMILGNGCVLRWDECAQPWNDDANSLYYHIAESRYWKRAYTKLLKQN